jgi:N-acetyl-anhydromuramyl-L-alanine amidase AmpD
MLAVMVVAAQTTACASQMRQRVPEAPPTPVIRGEAVIETPPLQLPVIETVWSPNFNERNGAGISAIVLHHTASSGNALAIARFFQKRQAKVSSHYIVDRDGSIVRCVPDDKRAWHAGPSQFAGTGNVNDFSLGIEICNRGDGIEPYPPAQVAAVTRLVANLAARYHIPMGRVTRHRDVALPRGIKIDPSDNFDFDVVVASARRLLDDHELWLAQRADRRASSAQPSGG